MSVAFAEREERNLTIETKDKEGLHVYGILKRRNRFKRYLLHEPMDVGTKLKVKFRTGDIGIQERTQRFENVDNEDDKS
ncbi:unnamed protein product, partial [Ectocarpus sp. 8 AP-2014]